MESQTTEAAPSTEQTIKKKNCLHLPDIKSITYDQQICAPVGGNGETDSTTNDRGIFKHVIEEGTGLTATEGSKMRIVHSGFLLHDDELISFDDGYSLNQERIFKEQKCFSFFKPCLLSMKHGEKAMFRIGSDYGFGGKHQVVSCRDERLQELGGIPANSTLIYYFEMRHLERKRPEPVDYSQRFQYAEDDRLSGNEHFRLGKFKEALALYNRAKFLLDNAKNVPEQEIANLHQAQRKTHLNLIKTYLTQAEQKRQKDSISAMKDVDVALLHTEYHLFKTDQNNSEILYLKAKAYYFKKDYEKALNLIQESLSKNNKDERANTLHSLISQKKRAEEKKHTETMQRAMSSIFSSSNRPLYSETNDKIEELYKKEEMDREMGRKVWFSSSGEEIYEYGSRFEEITNDTSC